MSTKSPFIRLAPLDFEDLPSHPSFPAKTTDKSQSPRPDLLPFVITLLDQGRILLHPTTFNLTFKHHSNKPSPPSNNEIEILSAELSTSQLSSSSGIPWSTPSCPRSKPAKIHDEYWYARRSYHHNLSVKRNAPGTASFNEFIYGLRDEKSKREAQFTTDLYDAHYICDWNEELNSLLSSSHSSSSSTTTTNNDKHTYTNATLTLHEMCHKLPSPASPRCFPVLVLTASVSAREFIAVTLPVDITRFPGAFYSTGRNQREGTDHMTKKSVTIGAYVAVEKVIRYVSTKDTMTPAAAKDGKHERERSVVHGSGENQREEIEWVMATASRAKGNIPMAVQRMGVPGAIAKDVGLFLKWIRDVPEEEIAKVRNAREEGGSGSGHGNGHGSSGLRTEMHAEPQSTS